MTADGMTDSRISGISGGSWVNSKLYVHIKAAQPSPEPLDLDPTETPNTITRRADNRPKTETSIPGSVAIFSLSSLCFRDARPKLNKKAPSRTKAQRAARPMAQMNRPSARNGLKTLPAESEAKHPNSAFNESRRPQSVPATLPRIVIATATECVHSQCVPNA
uniref:Uncharacterized protein n=1 Tax=Steinernema glaseri TaxID=37863 RepID=A0A1I8ACY9_9BILA